MHGGVSLGALGMPNILHMPFYFMPGVLRSNLSHIWCKIELTHISIKSGVVNSNIDGFFNCSGNAN